ncbi:MAG: hypothetical protein H6Q74_96 [Firmicutes bacterium]|nr:hypothetical protein [Bacillota bacterium]
MDYDDWADEYADDDNDEERVLCKPNKCSTHNYHTPKYYQSMDCADDYEPEKSCAKPSSCAQKCMYCMHAPICMTDCGYEPMPR